MRLRVCCTVAPRLSWGVGVATGAAGISHPEPCARRVSVRGEGPVPLTHTHSPLWSWRGLCPQGLGWACLSIPGWAGQLVSGAVSPHPRLFPPERRGAPLQMSLLPGAIYRVHFVHIQGLQSLLLVIKGKGETAAAALELGLELLPPPAKAGTGVKPWPFGPSPGGQGQG